MAAEDRLAQRRRLNRQLVRPDRDPDSGAPLPLRVTRQTVHQAQQDVSLTLRRWQMLDALPDLGHVQDKPAEPVLSDACARALELAIAGHTKGQIAQAMHCSYNRVDGWLRQAYKHLGVSHRLEAAAAWRARAAQHGSHLSGDKSDPVPCRRQRASGASDALLTARQRQILELASTGCARKDLPARLGITPSGVHGLIHSINKSLGVHSLAGAVQRYLALEEQQSACRRQPPSASEGVLA